MVNCSLRDWTRFCYVIGLENIWIHRPRVTRNVIGFVACADLFSSTVESGYTKYPGSLTNSPDAWEWTDAVSGKKKFRIQKYPDACVWTSPNQITNSVENKQKGSGQNYYTRTGPTKPQNSWWCLPAHPLLNVKRWCLYYIATPRSIGKKLQWDSNLTFLVCLVMPTLASLTFLCQLKFKSQ